MAGQVASLWADIRDWLDRNAPVSATQIQPPATDALITQVEAEIGRPLPADLREWWRQADGVNNPVMAFLLPEAFAPMSCGDALESRAGWLEICEGSPFDDEPDDETGDEQIMDFHPLFLPIGNDTCGDFLCVDLRDGPRHGCIGMWDHEGGWDRPLYWDSTTDMLTDIRDALVHGRPALVGHALRRADRHGGSPGHNPVFHAKVSARMELEWTGRDLLIHKPGAGN
jgi:cell wall assembly regulator SMI1